MLQVPLATLYVTLALTVPGIPVEAPSLSVSEKVMVSDDTADTIQVR